MQTTPTLDATMDRYEVPTGSLAAWALVVRDAEAALLDAYIESRTWNGTFAVEGMPLDDYARLECRLSSREVRRLRRCAEAARRLPQTVAVFRRGLLTLLQLDEIGRAVSLLGPAEASEVDCAVAVDAERAVTGDPDRPVALAQRLAKQHLAVREVEAAEDLALTETRLTMTPRLFGGGRIQADYDEVGFQTIAAGIQHRAGPPAPDTDRAHQLAEGLLAAVTGEPAATAETAAARSRPTVVVHVDLAEITDRTGGILRTALPTDGPAPTVSARTLETLVCNADLVVQLTEGARPLARLRDQRTLPSAVRAAVLDRDRGCRWPGCHAPAAWTDVHHITHRTDGGNHDPDNLVALCRRHHSQAHRHRWRLALDAYTGALVCRFDRPDGGTTMLESLPPRSTDPPPEDPQPDLWTFLDLTPPLPAWA